MSKANSKFEVGQSQKASVVRAETNLNFKEEVAPNSARKR